ncbi:MAG: universal stress protein [Nitrospiraceae bacterium]|nr:universal stress protein [Nitrospiraceae bacterium]
MNKMLIAIDGTEGSLRAVEYAGSQFSGMADLKITLLHVLPYPPAPLWDDGHIPTREENEERDKALDRWLFRQRIKAESIFEKALETLGRHNFSPEQIEQKAVSDSTDAAETILEQARDGGYKTLVVGRRGSYRAGRLFMGSVTTKIINHGAGLAICVVE